MKLARWQYSDQVEEGLVIDDRAVPFTDGVGIQDLLDWGLARALEYGRGAAGGAGRPLADVVLLTPLRPPAIRDFVAFEEHVEGVVRSVDSSNGVVPQWYEAPTFYFTNPHTLLATGQTLVPPASERLDFELEVAAVVGGVPGSDGRSLTPEEAQQHIFGYAVFNDWSARDLQSREMQVRLGPCKGKDFASTLGPWITTADEVADRLDADGFLDLAMAVSVNGREIGRDTLANMGWPFRDLLAYASRDSRIVPGDLLGSGTAGSGCLAELWGRAGELTPPPLRPGDEVTLTVEGLGTVTNIVGQPLPSPAIPRARQRPGSKAVKEHA
ncbi:2-keto-4-pentenoate hydratase/2-oxohepta-3-ene-1,7-dioic acid hydratase in catechol pathway [Sinomonas atrocyanea]|uniref:fumarylacetoacetate hydrolase family protein n=1 Tax=Sinomonas atrocyanea TaxID=37927 RepID=UPI00277F1E7E|nr:fumarylacetoacetate hydrolase family protein [Sinomonas atrocyanea]MDP9884560.1 2-keto-4-pentenoate hydratase/2-oxohepta-3-ene-1,7-dioic acid hydratase in catechol pathway [Sinomonas atrocyanea]